MHIVASYKLTIIYIENIVPNLSTTVYNFVKSFIINKIKY